MTKYQKPFLSLDEQIALLKTRGMKILDNNEAKILLKKINYYRLSAYWFPFRKRKEKNKSTLVFDNFKEEVSFSTVLDLYNFDKKLKLHVLDALEQIEIALRTCITIQLAKKDPLAHRNARMLHGHFSRKISKVKQETKQAIWIKNLDEKEKRSQEDFAKHFREKYKNQAMPLWIASELWDFGALSHLYAGMLFEDREEIAKHFQVSSHQSFQTWIRCLNDVRNVCAHHARLWNKALVNQPKWPKNGELLELDHLCSDTKAQTRVYSTFVIILYMLKTICPNGDWKSGLKNHLKTFPCSPYISLKNAGFPENWRYQNIWQ